MAATEEACSSDSISRMIRDGACPSTAKPNFRRSTRRTRSGKIRISKLPRTTMPRNLRGLRKLQRCHNSFKIRDIRAKSPRRQVRNCCFSLCALCVFARDTPIRLRLGRAKLFVTSFENLAWRRTDRRRPESFARLSPRSKPLRSRPIEHCLNEDGEHDSRATGEEKCMFVPTPHLSA